MTAALLISSTACAIKVKGNLTRSKVAASFAFGCSGMFGKRGPSNSSSSADFRIQGSSASTPSFSL